MRAERPVDSWRSNPPLGRGRPRTDPPGATPTSRPVRSGPAEGSLGRIRPGATIGNIPPLPQKEASGISGPQPRALGAPSSTTGTVGTATPTRVIGTDARYWHRRALSTTCMGYQHRRALYPPRGDNSPLTMSTTPSRCRQRAPVRGAPPPCEPTGRIPRSGATPPRLRTQGPRFTKHPMHTTA